MTAVGIVLLLLAAAWLALGVGRLVNPGSRVRTRALRRLQGVLLLAGGIILGGSAIALLAK